MADEQRIEMEALRKALSTDVFNQHLQSHVFGFHTRQEANIFYYTRSSLEAFHYSKGSPEWFQSLSNWIGHRSFRCERRDETSVAPLFTESMKQRWEAYKWTSEQQDRLDRFYTENWQRFGTALPVVIALPGDERLFHFDFNSTNPLILKLSKKSSDKPRFIEILVRWFNQCDHFTSNKPIPPGRLRCYTLPVFKPASAPF